MGGDGRAGAANTEVAMTGTWVAALRPMGVTEILDGAVRLARRNARAVLVVSVPYSLVATLATALLQYGTISSKNAATIAAIGTLLVSAGMGAVLTGLLAPLYSSDLLGRPITIGRAVRRVGLRAFALFALGLVIAVSEGVGLIACVVGGVWLWGVWAVAAPAFALEQLGVGGALGRSVALVKGSFWRVWGIRALGWLLVYILTQLIALPFALLALWVTGVDPLSTTSTASHAGLYVAVLAVGSLLSAAVLAPVASAVDVLLYTDLRMRKEGMDIVLNLPAEPPTAAPDPPVVSAW
jgi:hypothetical protein